MSSNKKTIEIVILVFEILSGLAIFTMPIMDAFFVKMSLLDIISAGRKLSSLGFSSNSPESVIAIVICVLVLIFFVVELICTIKNLVSPTNGNGINILRTICSLLRALVYIIWLVSIASQGSGATQVLAMGFWLSLISGIVVFTCSIISFKKN